MIPQMFDLTDKVAIVTGAAQGMGRAMAMALAEAGADLLVVDRNEQGVHRTAVEITAMGRRGQFLGFVRSAPPQLGGLSLTSKGGEIVRP